MTIASSPWAEYIKERQNAEVLETCTGFAIYSIKGSECYIEDIWVHPDFRKEKQASQIADQIAVIAKEKGCTYLTGSVSPKANNSTASLKVLLGYGFKLHSSTTDLIYFIKGID